MSDLRFILLNWAFLCNFFDLPIEYHLEHLMKDRYNLHGEVENTSKEFPTDKFPSKKILDVSLFFKSLK